MTSIDLILRLREHQRWAQRALVDAALALTHAELAQVFPIGQGTVLTSMTHLYAAEFVWLAAIEGNPRPMSPFDIKFDNMPALIAAWDLVDQRWQALFDQLDESQLDRRVIKQSTSSQLGSVMDTSLGDVLLHLFTHAQYTASQCKNMLRQLGKNEIPDVMLITLARRQKLGM